MDNRDDYQTLVTIMSVSGVVGLVVGIMRGVIQQKHGSVLGFIRGILASILVAVIVSWGLADSGLSINMRGTITGVCSFIADDILLGLMSLSTLLGRDPFGFFARMVAAYRGAALPTEKDKS